MGVKYLRFILLLVFFSAAYRYPCGLSEEIDVDNYEMNGLSAASKFNIMDELSLLYNDIHIGPVGIKPSYQVNEIYDDNVYDASEGEVSDLYTLHRPSLLIAADVHPKSKNKSAVKALYLLTFTPNSKLFSSDYPYVPAWQYFWQLYL